jgi:hypothetical protein
MTIRTGKGGRYRYYACSMKARQGPTACEGMAVPMDKLDDLVASHLEEHLLQPERLETILATCSTGGMNDQSASAITSPS